MRRKNANAAAEGDASRAASLRSARAASPVAAAATPSAPLSRPPPLAWPYALLFELRHPLTTAAVAAHKRMVCTLLTAGLRVAILRGGEECTSNGLLIVLVSACVTVAQQRRAGALQYCRVDDRFVLRHEALRQRFRRFRAFGIVDGVGGGAEAAQRLKQRGFALSAARELALTASVARRALGAVDGLPRADAAFALHDLAFNDWLRLLRSSMTAQRFLDELRAHFGERVAFYFAFVDVYVNSLALFALLCVAVYICLGSDLPRSAGRFLVELADLVEQDAANAARGAGAVSMNIGLDDVDDMSRSTGSTPKAWRTHGRHGARSLGLCLLVLGRLHNWTVYLCVCPLLGLSAAACWGPLFVRRWARRAASLHVRWLATDPILGLHHAGTRGATATDVVESDARNLERALPCPGATPGATQGATQGATEDGASAARRRRVRRQRRWVRYCANPCTLVCNAIFLVLVNTLFLQWYAYGLMAPSCACCALLHDASAELVRYEFEPEPGDFLESDSLPPGEWKARTPLAQARRAVRHARRSR